MKPFELVIEEHGPAILRYCSGRVGPERAEDLFQETMLAALRGYGDVREEDAVKSWLFTIAGRKSIDLYRSHDRLPTPTDQIDEFEAVRPSGQPGDGDIWQLVDQLPHKQALAIHLRYGGSLTHREIGQVMDISESAARRNVFEGLKRLRNERDSWI